MANKRRTRRGISKHDNDNAGVTKGGVWPREIDSILRLNCFDIWLWQFGKRIFCESIRGWSLNRGGDYRANRGLGILPNCLGVNWLIPRGGNRFFWSSKKCGVIGTVFRSSSWHRKRILVCIIFGLGVSHGPFHLHYAWDLPDFWRGWLAGWLEKKPSPPLDLHPFGTNVPVASFVSSSAGLRDRKQMSCCVTHMQIAVSVFSFYFHFFCFLPSASY